MATAARRPPLAGRRSKLGQSWDGLLLDVRLRIGEWSRGVTFAETAIRAPAVVLSGASITTSLPGGALDARLVSKAVRHDGARAVPLRTLLRKTNDRARAAARARALPPSLSARGGDPYRARARSREQHLADSGIASDTYRTHVKLLRKTDYATSTLATSARRR